MQTFLVYCAVAMLGLLALVSLWLLATRIAMEFPHKRK